MKTRILIILILAFGLFMPLNPNINVIPTTAGTSTADPPPYGDWIITGESVTKNNEIYRLNGSIIIESDGSLAISNTEIIFQLDLLNITVRDGGNLTITNSKITTGEPANSTHIEVNATVATISNTVFENVGIDSDHAAINITGGLVSVSDCVITTNSGGYAGINVHGVDGVTLTDNTIVTDSSDFNTGHGIYAINSNELVISGNNATVLDIGAGVGLLNCQYAQIDDNYIINSANWFTLSLSGNSSFSSITNNVVITNTSLFDYTLSIRGLPSQGYTDNIYIANNNFTSLSTGQAIYFDPLTTQYPKNYVFTNNTIYSPYGKGIIYEQGYNLTVSDNWIETNGNGIDVTNANKSIITGNKITKALIGIVLKNSNDSLISDNNIENTIDDAILLESLTGSNISSNVMSDINPSDIGVNAISATDCLDVTVSGNRIDFTGGDGVNFQLTNDSLITGNVITNAGNDGIEVLKGEDSTISDNIVTGSNDAAFYTDLSSYLTINNNTFYSNYGNGISAWPSTSHHLDIKGNTIVDNNNGIYLTSSSHNCTVTENYIAENHYGISIWGDDHLFYNNSFLFNFYGVYMQSNAERNLLYYNDFIDNTIQAKDITAYGANEWSRYVLAPESFIGNFWSDYDGVDVEAPSGVGDTPYNITGTANIADLYPLMEIITVLPPPTITSPLDVTILFNTTGNVIVWEAATTVRPQTYTISVNGTVMYSGTWDGSPIIYSLDSLAENASIYSVTITVYDSLGQATSDTVIVTVEAVVSEEEFPIDLFSAGIGLVGGIVIMGLVMVIFRRRG